MERTAGIEPALPPWEGGVLPLTPRPHGASGEIRTHDLRLTEAALCPLELQRQRSGSRTRICVRRFKDRPGCSNPPRNGAVSRCRPGSPALQGQGHSRVRRRGIGLRERGAATRCRPGPSAVRRRSRSRARRPRCRARIRTLTPVAQNDVACLISRPGI
jgi:hypothetical protein